MASGLEALMTLLGTRSAPSAQPPAPRKTAYDFGNPDGSEEHTGEFAGLSQGSMESPYELAKAKQVSAADARDRSQLDGQQKLRDMLLPDAETVRKEQLAGEVEKATAGPKIQAQGALDVEKLKANSEQYRADQALSAAQYKADATGHKPAKLNIQEQALTDAANAMSNLGEPLLQKYREMMPGIENDQEKYGGVLDKFPATIRRGMYSAGVMGSQDKVIQDGSAIKAWGIRALAAGRINESMLRIIEEHLPDPSYTPGANYSRLNELLHNILPAQLQGIGQGHQEFDPSNPLANYPSAQPQKPNQYADPNYQPR